MPQPSRLFLLDASIYVFRAWFGYPDRYFDQQGRPLNAVYGYLRTLLSNLGKAQPRYMVAAFDESLFSGFRHRLYPAYKANRALPDEGLAYQLALCKLLTEKMGIKTLGSEDFEADDLLAWAAQTGVQEGLPVTVVTRDKDLAQLIGKDDQLWDWAEGSLKDHAQLLSHWQVPLHHIPDLLALAGDAVDNIPGIRGVGVKTATQLIAHFDCLENLYGRLSEIASLPVRGAKRIQSALEGSESDAFLYRELVRLHWPETPLDLEQMEVESMDREFLGALFHELGLGQAFHHLLEQF